MKANELMIGDWVKHSITGKIGKVYRICGNEYIAFIDGDTQSELVEPIPITKELLLRSGFELKSESPYSQCFAIDFDDADIDYLVVELHPKANYVRVNYQTEKRKVHLSCSLGGCHLHELQHMLRMCSIKIDWKV